MSLISAAPSKHPVESEKTSIPEPIQTKIAESASEFQAEYQLLCQFLRNYRSKLLLNSKQHAISEDCITQSQLFEAKQTTNNDAL
jgi:hypothetical protein